MIKKIALLAGMALALVAFAAPAAQAELHFEEEGTFTGHGKFSSHSGALTSGPETVTMHGTVTETDHADIEGIAIHPLEGNEHIATNLPGCVYTATAAQSGTVTTETPDIVTMEGLTFTKTYTGVCAQFGVPERISIDGTITGTWTGDEEPNCIGLDENSDDLFVEVGGTTLTSNPVDLTGEICLDVNLTD